MKRSLQSFCFKLWKRKALRALLHKPWRTNEGFLKGLGYSWRRKKKNGSLRPSPIKPNDTFLRSSDRGGSRKSDRGGDIPLHREENAVSKRWRHFIISDPEVKSREALNTAFLGGYSSGENRLFFTFFNDFVAFLGKNSKNPASGVAFCTWFWGFPCTRLTARRGVVSVSAPSIYERRKIGPSDHRRSNQMARF